MDPNLHIALVAAIHQDGMDEALGEKRGEAARAVFENLSSGEEIELSFGYAGPALVWSTMAEGFTQLYDRGSDDAAVRDLSGIEGHPEIEVVHLPFSQVASLEPLRALESLRRLHIHVTAGCDLAPLLDLESLERVSILGAMSARQAGVLGELIARGVHADGVADWKRAAAPFDDRMLKLAVVGALAESGALELPELFVLDEYELDEPNLERVLLTVTPGDRRLGELKTLRWSSGGFPIQHRVYPQWDGETEDFDITSLAGIEALTALTALKIFPLESLPKEQVAALQKRGVEVSPDL